MPQAVAPRRLELETKEDAMSAQTAYIHNGVHLPATWILVLVAVLLVVVIGLALAASGHPIVTAPVQIPHAMPGPMA
jgi:hypothetical protein